MLRKSSHAVSPSIRASATRVASWVAIGVLALSLLAACGGDDTPATTPTPDATATPEPTPTVAISGPLTLGTIVWTTSVDPVTQQPGAPATAFASTSERLVAAIPVTNAPSGTVLTAYWSFNDTLLAKMTTVAVIERDTPEVWVSFSLTTSSGERWPAGRYEIEVVINSTTRQTAMVDVTE